MVLRNTHLLSYNIIQILLEACSIFYDRKELVYENVLFIRNCKIFAVLYIVDQTGTIFFE